MISYGDWKYESIVKEAIETCLSNKRIKPAFDNLFQSVELTREAVINIVRRVSFCSERGVHDEFVYSNIFRDEIKEDVNFTALARKFVADIREAEGDPTTAPVTAPRISLPMADLAPGKEFVDALVKADGDPHKAVDIVSKEPKLKRKISGGDKEEKLIQAAEKQLDPESKGDARKLARAVAREEKEKIKKKIMKRISLPLVSDAPEPVPSPVEPKPEPKPEPPAPAPELPKPKELPGSELTADDLRALKYPPMNPKDIMYMISGLLERGVPAWKIATENPRLTSRIISLLQRMGRYHDADTLRHYL